MKRVKLIPLWILILLICALAAGCSRTNQTDQTNQTNQTDPTVNVSEPAATAPPPLVGTPGDEMVENACGLYTPRMTEDAFRYLDEIYIEKYPALGLRWEHGTGADQRIVTAFAKQVTEGCTTDAEKVKAIYNWITANIRYLEESSPFSCDVLYSGYGNCLGEAMLMQDMCRVLGIPAVYSDGFRGNMKTFSVEAMKAAKEGHAWLFVYMDGQWGLYDPTWRTENVTDRAFIAEHFFIDTVGGITPVYDENHVPPLRSIGAFGYINGGFASVGEIGGGSILNGCMYVDATCYIENDGIFYWDGPAAFTYVFEMEVGEFFTNGWISGGDSCYRIGTVSFAYENGILASETVMRRGDETFYFRDGNGYKLCLPDEDYRLRNGLITVSADHTGKIWEPHKNMGIEDGSTLQWSSSDETVATVDENGVVTCHKPGIAEITLMITFGQESEPTYNSIPVYFSDENLRPAQYAALDPGGPAYTEVIDVPSIGIHDYYPVMTDDNLILFDPVDGVLTLPTAQNAKGYFILPETYENALTFPFDFELPLTEGSILLDRETLKTFTLVDTGKWGKMWYLPLTEEGKDVWGPGTAYEPEQNIDFGYPPIPTDELYQNGMWDPGITEAVPENGVIHTQLQPVVPELPMPNWTSFDAPSLQYVVDQGCALELIVRGTILELDTAAIQALLDQGSEFVDFWMVDMEVEWCDYGQQDRLRKMATDGIYNICFEANGTPIHDMNGGTATVTVPLSGSGQYGAFLVDAYGNFTEVPSTVNGGTITFEAPYFATYAIIDTAQTPVK